MSRSKEQWLEQTGGFRLGESKEGFLNRVKAIQSIHEKIQAGDATYEDMEKLRALKGIDVDGYEFEETEE
jgi:hypothetical protein